MADTAKIVWTGLSGATYEYYVHPIGTRFRFSQPGNYIFSRREAKPDGSGFVHQPIYIGESAEGLQERFDNHEHDPCIRANGATHVLVHNHRDRAGREAEETDLCRRWNTPCNHLTTPPPPQI